MRRCPSPLLVCGVSLLALVPSIALAQAAALPELVTSHLAEGVVHYRLVAIPEAKARRTTEWVTDRRFIKYRGTKAVLQVMTVGSGDHATIDSVVFDRMTLRPVWEHVYGAFSVTLAYAGTGVTGRVAMRDSADRTVNLTTSVPAFSGSIDDVVVQSIPLVQGFQAVFPFINGGGVEIDTIRVRGREQLPSSTATNRPWAVDLAYPYATETFWIDPIRRTILRHIYTIRKDHSMLEVRAR